MFDMGHGPFTRPNQPFHGKVKAEKYNGHRHADDEIIPTAVRAYSVGDTSQKPGLLQSTGRAGQDPGSRENRE